MMPLYRQAREVASELEAVSEPYQVQVGPRVELAQLFRDRRAAAHGPDLLFVEHPGFFDRSARYGEGGDYPDNSRRFASSPSRRWPDWPRVAQSPVILHALYRQVIAIRT